MPESRVLANHPANDGGPQEDPLHQAIASYKEAMRPPRQNLDVEFFYKTLSSVNESSALKIARNPIDADGKWIHETKLHNVRGIELGEGGGVIMRMRGDKTNLSIEKAIDQMDRIRRQLGKEAPVTLVISDDKQGRITDIYSHAFVKDAWAGLPFDLVLAYFEEEA